MKRKTNLVKESDSSINHWLGHPLYQWVDAETLPDYSDALRRQVTSADMGRLFSHGTGLSFSGVTYYPAGQYTEPGKAPLTALGPFWVVRIGQDVGDGHTAAFRVYLPAKWNGNFMGIAGGGTNNEIDWYTSGRFNVLSWPVALANGYACAATDNDSGTRLNCDWGFKPDGTPELDHIASWLGRALHEATVWGKAVTTLAYGRAPEKAYLQGTSGGGRQVLTEGVCHPEDYDGLWAGKLIITQGTGDPVVPFVNTFDYVRDMSGHFESPEAFADTCRLYRMPFAGHSILDWSGPAVSLADGMAGLTDWVERDEAPDTLPIVRYDFDHDMPLITGTSHYKNL